jgi:hypothetical protein
MKNSIKLFNDKKIRVKWDENKEKWYFSIVDVVPVLTENDYQTARKYWNKLSQRLREEGNETVTNCHQLKLEASDGKYYKTDVTDTEQILRLIQSIPSKKAIEINIKIMRAFIAMRHFLNFIYSVIYSAVYSVNLCYIKIKVQIYNLSFKTIK